MNLGRLIERCRSVTKDLKAPYFWSREDWTDYLNEAADEAAIRARLIENDQIELSVSAGEATVEYPTNIWSIRRVFLGGRRLTLTDRETIDAAEGEGWESITGTPLFCYEVGGKLRFYPIPEVDDTARLVAFCTPKNAMLDDDDEPELHPRCHTALIDWALFLAYSNHDADTFDPVRAADYEARFENNFGPRHSERELRQKRLNVRRHIARSFF